MQIAPGIEAGFTDRGWPDHRPPFDDNLAAHVDDDPREVAAARRRLLDTIGSRRLCFTRQVHGVRVATVGAEPEPGSEAETPADGVVDLGTEADALVTSLPDTALAVVVADCLPVLLAEPAAGVIAAAHAGRPGLLAGILPATVAAMQRCGADPARTVALIGPGICGACYEVPDEMRAEGARRLPEAFATTRHGTPALDLRAGAAAQLRRCGLFVRHDERCTAESPELFSHRRDGATGRFAGWIVRR